MFIILGMETLADLLFEGVIIKICQMNTTNTTTFNGTILPTLVKEKECLISKHYKYKCVCSMEQYCPPR